MMPSKVGSLGGVLWQGEESGGRRHIGGYRGHFFSEPHCLSGLRVFLVTVEGN